MSSGDVVQEKAEITKFTSLNFSADVAMCVFTLKNSSQGTPNDDLSMSLIFGKIVDLENLLMQDQLDSIIFMGLTNKY